MSSWGLVPKCRTLLPPVSQDPFSFLKWSIIQPLKKFFLKNKFVAVLGLRRCAGFSLVVVCGLLIAVASPVALAGEFLTTGRPGSLFFDSPTVPTG